MDDAIWRELRAEAVDAAEDKLEHITNLLRDLSDGKTEFEAVLPTLKLDVHSLKSIAASFEMKALKVLCHRFEDFIFSETGPNGLDNRHLQIFVDRLFDCLDAWVNTIEIDISTLIRKLPAKGNFDVDSVTVSDVEVMLVMEPGTANKIITRELVECGYRMVNVASTMDAIQLIPAMRPDLVIVSRVMPELSGVDLICAIRAMPTTRTIPLALIASTNDDTVQDLPPGVPMLHKGIRFADDVADVFSELGIL